MQLDVAIRALYRSMDLLCSKRGTKASAEEKEVTSTANVHTDHAYQSQERASDPLPTSQSNGPRSTRTEATPKRKKDPTKTWRFATAVASEDTVQASNAENDLKNEVKDAPEKGRHSTPAPDPAQSEGTCSHASGIIKRIRSMESKQAEVIDNLKQHTTREELDQGSNDEGFTPISMMIRPCTDIRDNSSREAGEVQLTQFSGDSMPHFYEWRRDVLDSFALLKVPEPLQGRHIRNCLRGSARSRVEAEMKFLAHPTTAGMMKVLRKWFGFHRTIVKQLIQAHMDCGRIPPPQRGWEGVFLRASEHRSIIRSMTILAFEVGKSDTIHLWDYMKTLCVMLPDQELHNLDMAYGD